MPDPQEVLEHLAEEHRAATAAETDAALDLIKDAAADQKPLTSEETDALDMIAKVEAERGKGMPTVEAKGPVVDPAQLGPMLIAQIQIAPPRGKQVVQSPPMEMIPMQPRGLKLSRRQVKTLLKSLSQPGDHLYIGVSFLWPDKMPENVKIRKPTGSAALPKTKED